MMKTVITLLLAVQLLAAASAAVASDIGLYEWQQYSDAAWTTNNLDSNRAVQPTAGAMAATASPSSIGSFSFHFTGTGSHYGGLYVDYEINETVNSFFNEYAGTSKSAAPVGLSWEIDEPGFEDRPYRGDIYQHFPGHLDNTIFNGTMRGPEDVAMAMIWNFSLADGEYADLTFTSSQQAPTAGFYLAQYDGPNAEDPIYFYAELKKYSDVQPVPEPSTVLLVAAGIVAVAAVRRKPHC